MKLIGFILFITLSTVISIIFFSINEKDSRSLIVTGKTYYNNDSCIYIIRLTNDSIEYIKFIDNCNVFYISQLIPIK